MGPSINLRFSDILKRVKNKKYRGFYTGSSIINVDKVHSVLFSKYKYLKK
jgi:hypothetical protein